MIFNKKLILNNNLFEIKIIIHPIMIVIIIIINNKK